MKKHFSLQKDVLRETLGEYLCDYAATLPDEKELDITFSDEFENKMEQLMHRQKRVYYYWTNTAFKKAICVLAALLLLAGLATIGAGAFRSPHNYLPATCTLPQQCTHCDRTAGEPLGHIRIPATCTTPMHCSVCGDTEGETLAHTYSDATCTAPRTCTECGATEGEPLPHTFETLSRKEPSCTKTGTLTEECTVCGEQRVTTLAKSEHFIIAPLTCIETAECGICGKEFADPKGNHNYNSMDGSCFYCGNHGPNYRPYRGNSSIFDGPASPFGDKGSPGITQPSPFDQAIPWDYNATQNDPFWKMP